MDDTPPSGREGGEEDANNDTMMQFSGDSSSAPGMGESDDDGEGIEQEDENGTKQSEKQSGSNQASTNATGQRGDTQERPWKVRQIYFPHI